MVKRVGKKKQDKLIRAIEYIKTHLAKSPSLPETAGFSSNTYFSDCFKRITGISPLQFRKAYTTNGRGANSQVERKAWL